MRDIAEFIRSGDNDWKLLGNAMLVQLLAAQVVAKAAYDGTRFNNLGEIRNAVFKIAGYPMRNRISGPPIRPNSDVDTETAYRVAELIELRVE